MRGMYRNLPRLRASGSSIMNSLTASQLRRKALNSLSAVQDTFSTTKVNFEDSDFIFFSYVLCNGDSKVSCMEFIWLDYFNRVSFDCA